MSKSKKSDSNQSIALGSSKVFVMHQDDQEEGRMTDMHLLKYSKTRTDLSDQQVKILFRLF